MYATFDRGDLAFASTRNVLVELALSWTARVISVRRSRLDGLLV
jgi:hypothetical protein